LNNTHFKTGVGIHSLAEKEQVTHLQVLMQDSHVLCVCDDAAKHRQSKLEASN
jgi:hypothetical protein